MEGTSHEDLCLALTNSIIKTTLLKLISIRLKSTEAL